MKYHTFGPNISVGNTVKISSIGSNIDITDFEMEVVEITKDYLWAKAVSVRAVRPMSKSEQKKNMVCWKLSDGKRRFPTPQEDQWNYLYVPEIPAYRKRLQKSLIGE